jgi:alpha-D-ribose 1-methylphosphonate 5-triphosphate synthase subunit PhnG
MACLDYIIDYIVGEDATDEHVAALISALLHRRNRAGVRARVLAEAQEALQHIVKAVKAQHAASDNHHKQKWLSVLAPSMTRTDLKALDWDVSSRSHASAVRHANTHGPGSPPPKPTVPAKRRRVTENEFDELREFLNDHSYSHGQKSLLLSFFILDRN